MADFAIDLKARLAAYGPLTALTDTGKLHWDDIPQGTPLPNIRLGVISDPRPEHLKGYQSARVSRVQADCFAPSWGLARDIAQKIIDAMALPGTSGGTKFGRTKAEGPWRGPTETIGTVRVFMASVDLLAEHTPA